MNYNWLDHVIIYVVLGAFAVACGAIIYGALTSKRPD